MILICIAIAALFAGFAWQMENPKRRLPKGMRGEMVC
jgi:hypothetical protein